MTTEVNESALSITDQVRLQLAGDVVVLRVYERSAVLGCEAPLGRPEVAELVGALVAWLAAPPEAYERPEHWPPQPGDTWADRHGNHWVCAHHAKPYLVCVAFQADDSADEINRRYGPMRFVYRPGAREAEVPF